MGPIAHRTELHGARRALWPLLLARAVWTSAVVSEEAVRFNLRLLATLTAVVSLPDLAQGLLTVAHAAGAARWYGGYVLLLAALELSGALLLAHRLRTGRPLLLLLAAAAGFYVEAALGLGGFERGLVAAMVFAVCIPAEAWVIWFLCHPRVQAHIGAWRRAC